MNAPFQYRLLDLLRLRKELRPEEVNRLLADLPVMLDSEPRGCPALLQRVAICFMEGGSADLPGDILSRKIPEWPEFSLLFLPAEAGDAAESVEENPPSPGGMAAYFAGLIYELLGGRRRDTAGAPCFPSLAALSGSANELLRQALAGGEKHGCTTFWHKWTQEAARGAGKTGAEWRIPPWLLEKMHCGQVLELTPFRSSHPPVRFNADRAFRIGRSRSEVDFPVRYSGHNVSADRDVKELSRRHVLAELGDAGVTLRDGDGVKPSTNGSAFDSQPLHFERPRPVTRRGVLALTDACRLEVAPVLRKQAIAFETANFSAWQGATAGTDRAVPVAGAVFFVPMDGAPPMRDAVWLFSEIGFTLSPQGRLVWMDADDAAAAWFVYRAGSFWIANAALPDGELCIDDSAIKPGHIAPLIGGSCLKIGTVEFSLTLG